MQARLTREFIRALAQANGLDVPEARLEIVARQYENYLRTLERLDTLNLSRDAQPAFTFVLPASGMPPASPPRRNGKER